MKNTWLNAATLLAGLLASVPAVPQEPPDVSVELAALKDGYTEADELVVRFRLTNNGKQAVRVLKWNTPLEGFNSDLFDVMRGSERIPYIGRVVKRGAPVDSDFIDLDAGKSVDAKVNLGAGYPITKPGQYLTQIKDTPLDVRSAALSLKSLDQGFRTTPKIAKATLINVLEKRATPKAPGPSPQAKKGVAYRNCADAQQSDILAAHKKAISLASEAAIALKDTPEPKRPDAMRYVAWFGSYNAGSYARATKDYAKIADALTKESVVYDCGCTENYYAFVYPTRPYEIYLCTLFWPAQIEATDSKSGTIVHETSHFDVVADTDDLAYGKSACLALAKDDPADALRNADSHEYFAENDPKKAMAP